MFTGCLQCVRTGYSQRQKWVLIFLFLSYLTWESNLSGQWDSLVGKGASGTTPDDLCSILRSHLKVGGESKNSTKLCPDTHTSHRHTTQTHTYTLIIVIYLMKSFKHCIYLEAKALQQQKQTQSLHQNSHLLSEIGSIVLGLWKTEFTLIILHRK